MKKKIFIMMCMLLALASGCAVNQNENPDSQNQEGTNDNNENSDNENLDGETANNDDLNNENQNTDNQENDNNGNTEQNEEPRQELEATLTTPTPTPTEEPTPTPTEEPTPEPTQEPTPEPTQEPSYTYTEKKLTMYANYSLNIRNMPSTDGEKIGSLSKGQEIKVIGVCNETGWYRISYGNKEAYVSNKYVTSKKPAEPTPTPTAKPTATPTPTPKPTQTPAGNSYTYTNKNATMYTTASIFVRSLPDKTGYILGGFNKDKEVKVTGVCKETGWYRIDYNGKVGYVSNDYVTSKKPSQDPTSTPTPSPTAKPTATPTPDTREYTYRNESMIMYANGSVFVRSLPNTTGKKIGSLRKAQEVTVTGICNETGWYRIIYNGSTGYVSNEYLSDMVE